MGAKRILVAGGPGVGKTALARKIAAQTGLPLLHADEELWHLGDDGAQEKLVALFERPAWIIEGGVVVSALQRWLREHEADASVPVDTVFWGSHPRRELSPDEELLLRAIGRVWKMTMPIVTARGATVETF